MQSRSRTQPQSQSVRQIDLFRRGGARVGAGRKPKGDRALVPHDTRARVTRRTPVLVTTTRTATRSPKRTATRSPKRTATRSAMRSPTRSPMRTVWMRAPRGSWIRPPRVDAPDPQRSPTSESRSVIAGPAGQHGRAAPHESRMSAVSFSASGTSRHPAKAAGATRVQAPNPARGTSRGATSRPSRTRAASSRSTGSARGSRRSG